MTIAAYVEAMQERFVPDPLVTQFHVIRERSTLMDGSLRARLALADGSQPSFPNICNGPPMGRLW